MHTLESGTLRPGEFSWAQDHRLVTREPGLGALSTSHTLSLTRLLQSPEITVLTGSDLESQCKRL